MEFILVPPTTNQKAAVHLANRMRAVIAAMPVAGHTALLGITASFGVAQIKSGETVDAWLNRADRALYKAKADGRNCVDTI